MGAKGDVNGVAKRQGKIQVRQQIYPLFCGMGDFAPRAIQCRIVSKGKSYSRRK